MQFGRTRRKFGCEGNPTELFHCDTYVVRKHGDYSLSREILAVTIFDRGKAGMPYSAFFLLVRVWTPMWSGRIGRRGVFTCMWLTWFDARQYADRRLALGWALHGTIWLGSLDWSLAWARSSRHEKRPNRSKRSRRTKQGCSAPPDAVRSRSLVWARTDSIHVKYAAWSFKSNAKIKRKHKGSYSHIG